MKQIQKRKKFAFWLFGFTMPFFLLALRLTFYSPIEQIGNIYTEYQVYIEWIANFILGVEVIQIWLLRRLQKLDRLLMSDMVTWIVWGMATWFIFVASLFLLLPIVLLLSYA